MPAQPFEFQDGPVLRNQYTDDKVLTTYLRRILPPETVSDVATDLVRFGERVSSDVLMMALNAEENPPRLVNFDPWGRRVDHIETAQGWRDLDRVSAEEGLIAIGYERRLGRYSRIHQFAKLYLFDPSSAVYSCPLAMTDGAARLLEIHGSAELKAKAFHRLTTRDPNTFWTSGQWMTERSGGSDVGRTATVARRESGVGGYRLYGDKWFTSATTSQMAMTLARIEDESGRSTPGSRGLSLFYLETRAEDGQLNGVRLHRLKDKLGTKALPTAELTLEGATAKLVAGEGEGVRTMSTLFNLTRIHNAVCAAAKMRRAVALARDYSARREAFGKRLIDHPLHVETLAVLEVEARAAFHLVFSLVERLGTVECSAWRAAPPDARILRLVTPVAKLFTAKQAIAVISEVLECFGGAGYVENTGLPKLLRDAQVLAIWEGTTNVLSLDVLRAIEKDSALPPLLAAIDRALENVVAPELAASVDRVRDAARSIGDFASRLSVVSRPHQEVSARPLAFAIGRTWAGVTLLEHAQWAIATSEDPAAPIAANRWCRQALAPSGEPSDQHIIESQRLGL